MKRKLIWMLLFALCGSLVLTGCGSKTAENGEVPFSEPVVEEALTSLSQGDYTTYAGLFIKEGREQMTEEQFQQGYQLIKDLIGRYVSKTYQKVQQENGYMVAYYQAEFTKETGTVEVRAVFQEEDGEMKLAGFWLNSPKLRGE